MKDFYSLFIKELKDIKDAEIQLSKGFPDLIKMTHTPQLKELLQTHHKETKEQIKRLDAVASELSEDIDGGQNEVVKSFVKEAHKIQKGNYDPVVRDAALIDLLQQIEHYEIASYGALKAFAKHLKFTDIYNILDDSSREEGNMNKALTTIAEGNVFQKGVNDKACEKVA
ncbi:MAG TPA: DUF892 family protein [Rhabdochlamydiaceae bacterium]|jgi:ferritin-like metal-binding protein YciE